MVHVEVVERNRGIEVRKCKSFCFGEIRFLKAEDVEVFEASLMKELILE